MKCEHVSPRVSAFIDGELPTTESAEIRRHLDGCERCAASYARESLVWSLVTEQPQVSPRTDLWPRIDAQLAEQADHSAWGGFRWNPFQAVAAALAVVGIVLGVQLGTFVTQTGAVPATTAGANSGDPIDVLYLADVFPGSLADTVLSTPVEIQQQGASR